MVKISRNRKIWIFLFCDLVSRGNDVIIEISMSKIRNSRAIRKNWWENGVWDGFIRLNPHSNWDSFSLSVFIFLCVSPVATENRIARASAVTQTVEIFISRVSF